MSLENKYIYVQHRTNLWIKDFLPRNQLLKKIIINNVLFRLIHLYRMGTYLDWGFIRVTRAYSVIYSYPEENHKYCSTFKICKINITAFLPRWRRNWLSACSTLMTVFLGKRCSMQELLHLKSQTCVQWWSSRDCLITGSLEKKMSTPKHDEYYECTL